MEKYIFDKKVKSCFEAKRSGNVKIISIPGKGKIYVCPYPESHLGELVKEKEEALSKR